MNYKRGRKMRTTIFVVGLILLPSLSFGMPYFARKYGTSCNLCHTAYPKLNAYGESFRLHGYRFPKGDEEMAKIKQIPLGGEWPSKVAAIFPAGGVGHLRAQRVEDSRFTFELHELEFFYGDSLGETFSFWADFTAIDEGTFPGTPFSRMFLGIYDLFGARLPKNAFNLQLGYFEPATNAFSAHRRLMLRNYLYSDTRVVTAGPNLSPSAFRMRNSQLGAELNGIVADRLSYSAAVVNGSGNLNDIGSQKDYYARLLWKPVGMHFNGEGDMSEGLRAGGFGYFGRSNYTTDNAAFRNSFFRVGGDIGVEYHSFELSGLFQAGRDGNMDALGRKLNTNSFAIELLYNQFFWAWLTPVFRYEEFNYHESDFQDFSRYVISFVAQPSPNMRFTLEGLLHPEHLDGKNSTILEARYSF